MPLQALPQAKAAFEIHNSPLSENRRAWLRYGYNVQAPAAGHLGSAVRRLHQRRAGHDRRVHRLGAREVAAEPSLVLLLPHGTRDRGRITRAGVWSVSCSWRPTSTSGSPTHDGRAVLPPAAPAGALLKTDPLPLVVMTPKSLLRHPRGASTPRDLAERGCAPVIDDAEALGLGRRSGGSSPAAARWMWISPAAKARRARDSRSAGWSLLSLAAENCGRFSTATRLPQEIVWLQEEPQTWARGASGAPPAQLRPAACRSAPSAAGARARPKDLRPRHARQQQQLIEAAFAPATGVRRRANREAGRFRQAAECRVPSRQRNPEAWEPAGVHTCLQRGGSRSRRVDRRRAGREVAQERGRPRERRRPPGRARDRQDRSRGRSAQGGVLKIAQARRRRKVGEVLA